MHFIASLTGHDLFCSIDHKRVSFIRKSHSYIRECHSLVML